MWDIMEIERQKEESFCRTKNTGQDSGGPGSLVSQHLHLSNRIVILAGPTLPGCTEDQERQYSRLQNMLYKHRDARILMFDNSYTLMFYGLANQGLVR